jgi:hypothetical protein
VLVPGSISNPDAIRAGWQASANAPVARLTELLVEQALGQERIVWHDLLQGVLDSAHSSAGLSPDDVHVAVRYADRFVRAERRTRALAALRQAGVTATICGSVQPPILALDGHDVRGPVSITELLELMARSRVVVDTGAAFPSGSHERGLCAMMNGALTIVERNAFWDEFGEDEVHRFSWQDVERLAQAAHSLSDDAAGCRERGRHAQLAVERGHTAAHRAAAVVDAVTALRPSSGRPG